MTEWIYLDLTFIAFGLIISLFALPQAYWSLGFLATLVAYAFSVWHRLKRYLKLDKRREIATEHPYFFEVDQFWLKRIKNLQANPGGQNPQRR